ncbi:hypothetical protein [Streptomyces chrestomyceticus]|uniref:hypothetical protein n=1 Tax=Streptomyces chrestomyceticus TaxID=68185 RepID=UPI0037BB505C
MPYKKDAMGMLHKMNGLCADCGRPGTFAGTVVVPGKGPFGSNKPLAVYACDDHRIKRS